MLSGTEDDRPDDGAILARRPLRVSPSVDVALAILELSEEPTCAASLLGIPHGLVPGLTAEAHRAAWSIMRRSRRMTASAALASVRTIDGWPVPEGVRESLVAFSDKLRQIEYSSDEPMKLISFVLDDSGFGLEAHACLSPDGAYARTDLGCLRGLASRCRTLDDLLAAIDQGSTGSYLAAEFDDMLVPRTSHASARHVRPLPTRESYRAKWDRSEIGLSPPKRPESG